MLANLDTAQLSLERAKNDAQIVQSLTALKLALQNIRKKNGMKNCDVAEMMVEVGSEAGPLEAEKAAGACCSRCSRPLLVRAADGGGGPSGERCMACLE